MLVPTPAGLLWGHSCRGNKCKGKSWVLEMSTHDKDRRRRRVGDDRRADDGRRQKARLASRSRSRRRERRSGRQAGDPSSGVASVPPQDWIGPAREAREPPPTEWRGPGAYPPQRPPGPYAPMPPMPRGLGPPMQYSWMPPRPEDGQYHAAPPGEWRGPAMPRPQYDPRGDPSDIWVMRSPSAPQGSPFGSPGADPWGARPPGSEASGFPGPVQHGKGTETEKAPPATLALTDADPPASVPDQVVPVATVAPDVAVDGGTNLGVFDGDEDDALPPPRTLADRLRNVQIVQSALSQGMLTNLRKSGVPLDNRFSQRAPTSITAEEVGLSEDVAASRECTRLGLNGSAQRRLPMQGPLRLPVCTVELQQVGLWDRFRQRCGTQMPPEPPPTQCVIQKSRGGGQVVVPHVGAVAPGPAVVAPSG